MNYLDSGINYSKMNKAYCKDCALRGEIRKSICREEFYIRVSSKSNYTMSYVAHCRLKEVVK